MPESETLVEDRSCLEHFDVWVIGELECSYKLTSYAHMDQGYSCGLARVASRGSVAARRKRKVSRIQMW